MKTLPERFSEKYETGPGCWIWKSAFTTRGYGFFWVGGAKRSEYAHRVAWELANGEQIPNGKIVMHSCDNPACVNPAHLSIGSNKDNSQDAVRKGRNAYGERNGGGRKLTETKVRLIKELLCDGWSCNDVAKYFEVSSQTAKAIRRGRIWNWV